MHAIAKTPKPPYVAVIFTTVSNRLDEDYESVNKQLETLLVQQPGFIAFESSRQFDLGITVSYWENIQAVQQWKQQALHLQAQKKARANWYKAYKVRICQVERDYEFSL